MSSPEAGAPAAPREHGRAQGRAVPGPHPRHGRATEEPRDQDSGGPGFRRPGGRGPEMWLVLQGEPPISTLQTWALVALRRVLLAQFSAFPCNGADLYEELKTSTAILSTGIGREQEQGERQAEGEAGSPLSMEPDPGLHPGPWDHDLSRRQTLNRLSQALLYLPHFRVRPSGNVSLDKLLDAGLYTGEVTEIVGGPGSGKTQVCLCVAANVAYDLQQNVVYIDSSGGLTASRILQLLQARTPEEEEQVSSASVTVKVVVVDSVTAVVSPLLGGQQREGLALMMQLARELKTLARDLGMAVVVTNHMTRDRDSGELKPALGRSWSFVPSTRILLDIDEGAGVSGSRRRVYLTKSPRLPTGFQEMVDIGTWAPPEQSPASQGDQI
ncbi:DNA repair protein RAD51 homolog 4 isoform X4 [Mirounga angustirostris]|uniref:DNA repair protein RAD51 homolog 4 isoform X4 n=1 Tax=Mirounga angustirostris TaxID=9716 RepID=UPI00313B0DC3